MSVFDQFKRTHGPGSGKAVADRDSLDRYRNTLPGSLIRLWEEDGWSSYANGFLRVTNPADLEDVLDDWLDPSSAPRSVVAHTALGHLFLWTNNTVYLLNPHNGHIDKITEDAEILFDTVLCDDIVLLGLRKDLYDSAVARLGKPAPDECFGFVPALALGGDPVAENLQRVKLREYLAILAQVAGDQTNE